MKAVTRAISRRTGFLASAMSVLSWLAAVVSVCAAEAPALQEHQVKALYLFNFTKYVEWPESARTQGSHFLIGVIGAPEVAASLVEATQGREVSGRTVEIARLDAEADLRRCNMVYLGTGDRAVIARILDRIGPGPVLTVGEGGGFVDLGGVIGFVRKDNKVRLCIGLDVARRVGLRVSAKLLAVAEEVRGGRVRPTE